MTGGERWLLPEGIEEVLPPEAASLERLRRQLVDLYYTWGYDLVMPPFIEYLDSLLTGMGNDLDLETFRLTDQLTGRMMGLRADMTPQVARIDAHHLRREVPVLYTRPGGFMRSRSPLQVGAELYGRPSGYRGRRGDPVSDAGDPGGDRHHRHPCGPGSCERRGRGCFRVKTNERE